MKKMPKDAEAKRRPAGRRTGRLGAAGGILLAVVFSTGLVLPARGEEAADTLFLRDGSVLQGTVLQDAGGRYHVTNPLYGKVAVEESAVLYYLPQDRDVPFLSENQVILPGTLEVLSTFSRPVPERSGESTEFHLLVPGSVDAVHAADGAPIDFKSRDIAGSSLVTIKHSGTRAGIDRIFVTSVQKEILSSREDGSLEFRTKRILDEGGTIRLMVEYPQDWSVRSVFPEPAFRYTGMIVWETPLKRQQTFLPTAVFLPEDPQAASIGEDPPAKGE